jgi:hypothetical protein
VSRADRLGGIAVIVVLALLPFQAAHSERDEDGAVSVRADVSDPRFEIPIRLPLPETFDFIP